MVCAKDLQIGLLEDLSQGRFFLSGRDNVDVAVLNDETRWTSKNDIEDHVIRSVTYRSDIDTSNPNTFLVYSTGRNMHRAFPRKSLGIEEAAAHPLAAFYVEVAAAVKSRCVTVCLAMRLPGFSHLQFSPSGALSYGRFGPLTCYQARSLAIESTGNDCRAANDTGRF